MATFELRIDETLALTRIEHRHAATLFELTATSRDYLKEWLPWADGIRAVDDTRNFIRRSLEQLAAGDGFHCLIWFKGEMAGVIGLDNIDWTNRNTEIGYWLGQAYQGHGLMVRSCRALVDYAFSELDLNRVQIRAAVGNQKSRKIPERLGFVEEGILRQAEQLHDRAVDLVVYGQLRREWEPTDPGR